MRQSPSLDHRLHHFDEGWREISFVIDLKYLAGWLVVGNNLYIPKLLYLCDLTVATRQTADQTVRQLIGFNGPSICGVFGVEDLGDFCEPQRLVHEQKAASIDP